MSTPHPEALSSSSPDSTPPAPLQSAYRTSGDPPFLTRTVRQQDLLTLADLLASSFHGQEGWMRWVYPLLKAGIYEDLRSRFQSRSAHYACLVAIQPTLKGQALSGLNGRAASTAPIGRDTLVGTVELSLKTPSLLQPWNTKYLYLSNLAVKSNYRRQGVAQQLLQTCEKIALDWGFTDLYLHVLENNHQARRLYWKAGYRVQRIEMNPLTLLLGQPRQLFLRKRLTESGESICS